MIKLAAVGPTSFDTFKRKSVKAQSTFCFIPYVYRQCIRNKRALNAQPSQLRCHQSVWCDATDTYVNIRKQSWPVFI